MTLFGFGHPRAVELGAWFDGEPTRGATGRHVTGCRRCRGRVTEYARIRSWLRAQPFVEMGASPDEATTTHGALRRLVVSAAGVAAVLLLLLLAWLGADPASSRALRGVPHRVPSVVDAGQAATAEASVAALAPSSAVDGPAIPPDGGGLVPSTTHDLAGWLRSAGLHAPLALVLGADGAVLVPPAWPDPAPTLAGMTDSPVPAPLTPGTRPAL